jgi:flagellar motility protein MotE (MotC chaperone)
VALLIVGLALLGAEAAQPAASPDDAALENLELEARRLALETLERDLERKVEALQKLREETQAELQVQEREHDQDLEKLVKFYQAMKPQKAALLLEELPLDLAAEVLGTMKPREAGKILNSMKPSRAVQLSRRMAGAEK